MSCLRHSGFAKGEATTAFIGEYRDELLAPRADVAFDMALAGLLLYVTNPQAPAWRGGRSLAATFPLPSKIEIAGQHARARNSARERDGRYTVATDGSPAQVRHRAVRS